ncbi:gluconate 2-dehydrogenase subunit 3 family protein [Paraburkholderia humisilvae]|uniref:Gluconate 2-dehydrogenase subunit 3 n=1 Tax=Paraburkholderia humisilvae TaxID=627669 RepID=A0A6J5EEP5_9BURK|nr:gluconate 2-dehydrogenase subunit 3 family protein [Paraburkholderia humisilvae]CAB3763821.1 Gluconate 2-dehydrogenase subunit 3 [Paraburkholderia humisilvae]
MKNDDQPRRKFLRQVFTILPATAIAPVIVTQEGCTHSQASDTASTAATVVAATTAAKYAPVFFTTTEWDFIHAAVEELIPADHTGAGAREAGVPEFIDRQMETPYGHGRLWYMQGPFHPEVAPELGYQLGLVPRDVYRHGIEACNAACVRDHGKVFAELPRETRVLVLEQLEAGKLHLDAVPPKLFFSTLLQNTKEGYFADPMYGGNKGMSGWKMIGFPGARADFADWVEQPGAKYPLGPVSILGEQA